MTKKKKNKIDFRYLLIEALLIVFTVSLAMALNEWRANVKEEKTVEKVRTNILNEIKANRADLIEKMAYHQETSQRIARYLANDSLWATLKYKNGIEVTMQLMPRGIFEPNLQSGAWDGAVLSGLVNSFEYEFLEEFSTLYHMQADGPNSSWKVMAGFFSESSSYEPENAKTLMLRFQLSFAVLHSQEQNLLNMYNHGLKNWDAAE
ncbi:MAG: hypothetical protein AAFO69_05960 [Bacteroidota bacterium]